MRLPSVGGVELLILLSCQPPRYAGGRYFQATQSTLQEH